MADPRVPPTNLDAELLERSGEVRPQRDHEVPSSLAVDLTDVVDDIRQLYTDFGMRSYRVFLTHIIWGSGTVGVGAPSVLSRQEVLPTPLVRDLSGVSQMLAATGLQEEGQIVVSQISPKYSEDDLMGQTPDLQDPALMRTSGTDRQFFWEVESNRRIEPRGVPRRFTPVSAPSLSRDGFSWTISLVRQDFDSSRSGSVYPRNDF